ncbi:MAG: hypothetical protein ABI602_00440 [Candidatus Saccharibacteria bacterium]
MQSLIVLGRQPALALAELESLYGPSKVRPIGGQAALLDIDPCLVAFDRLGGAIKFCKVLTILKTTQWREIERFLVKSSPEHTTRMPEGKMQLGLSVQGLDVNIRTLEATGLNLKKAIRKIGRSVRLVPNKELELNSAQVIHNHLTGPTGWELLLIRDGSETIVAQTVRVQDINSYTLRDRERPKRDARVGMLPPKLAQIIVNLATGFLPEDKMSSICDIPADQIIPRPHLDQTVLDPFCGTGVLLQEAALMGYDCYGSDLEARMVDYTKRNLDWLEETYRLDSLKPRLEVGDATAYSWAPPIAFVAAETYLGRPFTTQPPAEILAQTASDCNLIIKRFLQNIYAQVPTGTRFCLAIPAWQIRTGQFKHLPLVDQISEMGYNRVSFEHASDDSLLYYRPDQIVARELIVLTKR